LAQEMRGVPQRQHAIWMCVECALGGVGIKCTVGGSQTQANCQGWLLLPVTCLPVPTGAHSPLLFTCDPLSGPEPPLVCLLHVCQSSTPTIVLSLHYTLYPEPISRRFIPFASLYGGTFQGAADKFHRLDFCHDAPRFNTTRRPWASLTEPPVQLHRAC
jgi:hypothetical protein